MSKINLIDEYINDYPDEIREILTKIRMIIIKSLPECEERLSWGMPTFYWHENVIHFAVGKKHIGVYPSPTPIIHFKNELQEYKTSKGAIQLPIDKPIPYDLIEKIIKYRASEINEKYKS